MTDRLAEIKRDRKLMGHSETASKFDWLIAEVERLQAELYDRDLKEVARRRLMETQHARNLKTAPTQHKPECG